MKVHFYEEDNGMGNGREPVSSQTDEELSPGLFRQGAVTRVLQTSQNARRFCMSKVLMNRDGETEARGHLVCLWQS